MNDLKTMPKPRAHLAELLLDTRLHGVTDALRSRRPFSPDIEAIHAVLFSPRYDRQAKIRAYRACFLKTMRFSACDGEIRTSWIRFKTIDKFGSGWLLRV